MIMNDNHCTLLCALISSIERYSELPNIATRDKAIHRALLGYRTILFSRPKPTIAPGDDVDWSDY